MSQAPQSLKGQLLIASRDLVDPNFQSTVVLLVQHSPQGAMGVVVNRPSETTVADAWERITTEPCNVSGLMHVGGPCEGTLSVVHVDDVASDIEVLPGLHFSANKDSVEKLFGEGHLAEMRVFVGYAGWGPGQLEGELEHGGWHLLPASKDLVFAPHSGLWEKLLKKSAGHSVISSLGIKHVPDDPAMN